MNNKLNENNKYDRSNHNNIKKNNKNNNSNKLDIKDL